MPHTCITCPCFLACYFYFTSRHESLPTPVNTPHQIAGHTFATSSALPTYPLDYHTQIQPIILRRLLSQSIPVPHCLTSPFPQTHSFPTHSPPACPPNHTPKTHANFLPADSPSVKPETLSETPNVKKWIDNYLWVGETFMDQSVAFFASSAYFERKR